ncbi:MAG TPA: hypothetical protein VHB77_02815 [Planctomycetaceae bacterium]|nr:hypothetical protein [Planctomycetaceae bacterium]
MNEIDPQLLRQEVEELTQLLREDPGWDDLRAALKSKGLPPGRVVLAGFFEDEDSNEFGVIVTDALETFEYQRETSGDSNRFVVWKAVADPRELLDTFPAVEYGLELARRLS